MAAWEVAPFGGSTFATDDAVIQYLDFFAYWQKVLLDGASMTFSFDKGLGGNLWAVMTYYLFSPLNFMVIFFSQENLQLFYNLLVVIKLGLCGATMTYYLQKRFEEKLSESAVFVLSVGYGLMNYNLLQAKNVMWLDGAYMLPLMLLGLYRFRREGRWSLLVIASALCILFNWYMGLVDAVFVGLFSLVEYFIPEEKFSLRKFLCFELKVACALLLALGVNGWQFLPTLEALSDGRGSIDWQKLNLRYSGNPLSMLQGLAWGAVGKESQASFFVGDLATFGAMAFFLQKNISRRMVWIGSVLLAFIFLMFYWQPCFFLFSLLKDASSYWYRYAHLASFILIFLASFFLLKRSECAGWRCRSKWGCIFLFSLYPLMLIGVQYHRPSPVWEGLIGAIVLYAILVCYFSFQEKLSPALGQAGKKIMVAALLGGCIANAAMLLCQKDASILYTEVSIRQKYTGDSIKRTADFKKLLDSEAYRTSQSRFFSPGSKAYLTANYNEGLAYGYHSLATYTSSPVNAQLYLYDRLGYKKNGDNFNVLNVSLLPADSLFGVNYVFADRPVEGLQPIMQVAASEEIKQYENTVIYSNPFALPLAFVCQDFELSRIEYRDNPFSYTNEVYSMLLGEKIDVYREVPYQIKKETDNELICEVGYSSADAALYGDLKKGANANLISVNGEDMYYHSTWLGNSVFYVPRPAGEASELRFLFREGERKDAQLYFYRTDPSALQKAHDKAADRAAAFEKFSDHELVFTVEASEGEKLFTSLPYDKGWQITLNGHEVKPVKACEALIGLQLEEGENRVEMHYTLPGLKKGLIVTVVSIFFLWLLCTGRIKCANK